jgi:hypothetical protein
MVKVTLEKLKGNHMNLATYTSTLRNDVGFDGVGQLLDACIHTKMMRKKPGGKYELINQQREVIETFTEDTWREYVEKKGGFDVVYQWWFDNAQANGTLLPWGESRYDTFEPEIVADEE